MTITQDTAVTIAYKITDAQTGQVLDSGTTAYLHGHGNLFPKVEAGLEGQGVGAKVEMDLPRPMRLASAMKRWCARFPRANSRPG